MTTLSEEEKRSLVMIYTQTSLVRGEVVTKKAVRVSTWLRTQGVPDYIHLFDPSLVYLGAAVRVSNFKELYLPVSSVIGFHLTPPSADPMDYDDYEINRTLVPVTGLVGAFLFKGSLRISAKADLSSSIELAHSSWMSIYNVEITCPSMPQMQAMQVPLILIDPKRVSFGVE